VRRFVEELSQLHDRPFKGISGEAMLMLVSYNWPGNIRELRNLIESMVVLAPGREISAEDIPRQIRDGVEKGRYLPVHVGPSPRSGRGSAGRSGAAAGLSGDGAAGGGHELEFIVRSLVELKLQIEELRRRVDEERMGRNEWLGEIPTGYGKGGMLMPGVEVNSSGSDAPANVVTVTPGMRMEEIERLVIEAALRETHGNRRKAADMLGIGERTLYRKLKEYRIPEEGLA
jgi:DNA-binding NtrC family response regulator